MNTLCLYTANYPYGLGEQFIETEIKYLAKAFKRVVIIPAQPTGEKRPVPKNVEVIHFEPVSYTTTKGVKNLGSWFLQCLPDSLKQQQPKIAISTLMRTGVQAQNLHVILKKHKLLSNTLHYTYWFNEWSTMLSILRSTNKIKGFISRAHGFDLYNERQKLGFIPYRKFQLKHVSKLYLISQNGVDYLSTKYPKYKEKYELSYLGIENNQPFTYNPPDDEQYLIVSCSRIVNIKRIDLIVEALALIYDLKIKWVHFGDGELAEKVKAKAKKLLCKNIVSRFMGHLDNQDIYSYYKNNHVDCFINLSSSEGLPVTIMEAISFGIPVVATNVGGTSEITTKQTGILLKTNPTIPEIQNAIKKVLLNYARNETLKQEVYCFWSKNFNAQNNYSRFVNNIQNP